jgi:hypothetical protein
VGLWTPPVSPASRPNQSAHHQGSTDAWGETVMAHLEQKKTTLSEKAILAPPPGVRRPLVVGGSQLCRSQCGADQQQKTSLIRITSPITEIPDLPRP